VHHLRPTDAALVGDVIIGLQNSLELTQKPQASRNLQAREYLLDHLHVARTSVF